jgi:hypothetical protein
MSTMAEWEEAEDHITEALKSLGNARRTCPVEAKAIELLELEVQLSGLAANLPNFLAAQYELDSP